MLYVLFLSFFLSFLSRSLFLSFFLFLSRKFASPVLTLAFFTTVRTSLRDLTWVHVALIVLAF